MNLRRVTRPCAARLYPATRKAGRINEAAELKQTHLQTTNSPIRPYKLCVHKGNATKQNENEKPSTETQQGGGATHTVVDGHPVVEIGSVRAGRPASFSFPFPFHGASPLFIQLPPPPPPRFFSLPLLHSPYLLLSPRTHSATQFLSAVSSSDFPATSSPLLHIKFPTHPNQLRKALQSARPTTQ